MSRPSSSRVSLPPSCVQYNFDVDGTLLVVARHGRFVVGGYSRAYDQRRFLDDCHLELERAVAFSHGAGR